MGWQLRVLDIYVGKNRIWGGVSSFTGAGEQQASETVAQMIHEALQEVRGDHHGEVHRKRA